MLMIQQQLEAMGEKFAVLNPDTKARKNGWSSSSRKFKKKSEEDGTYDEEQETIGNETFCTFYITDWG